MSLQDLKARALQNPEVRAEYEAQMEEFALINELIRMRRQAGLTQEQVAHRMHTKKSNISRLERGNTAPRLDTVKRYAKACGFEVSMSFQPVAAAG